MQKHLLTHTIIALLVFLMGTQALSVFTDRAYAAVGDVQLDLSAGGQIIGSAVAMQKFADSSNNAYFLDPAATDTSLVTAGNIGIGTTSPAGILNTVVTSTASPRGPVFDQINSGADGSRLEIRKARGSLGSLSTISAGDTLGNISFWGYDGSNYLNMAAISIAAEGTVASTRVPTNIKFWTGTNAAPSVLTQRMIINSSGYVGIGTGSPGAKLEVAGDFYFTQGAARNITVTKATTTGANGDNLSITAGEAEGTGISPTGGDVIINGGFGGTTYGDVVLANSGGYVGIGTATPGVRLDVSDTAASAVIAQVVNASTGTGADGMAIQLGPTTNPGAGNDFLQFKDGDGTLIGAVDGDGAGGVTYDLTSDARLKTGIQDFTGALDIIKQVQPRTFYFKTNLNKQQVGFIAQELMTAYPWAVSGDPTSDPTTDPMMVDYSRLTPLLVGAVKEQQKEIEALRAELNSLKAALGQ